MTQTSVFQLESITAFVIEPWSFDATSGQLRLRYRLQPGWQFVETMNFGSTRGLPQARQAALERAFDLLSWMAGVSYYKAALPGAILLEGATPSDDAARLLEQTYRHGLAEMVHRLGLDWSGVAFPRSAENSDQSSSVPLQPGVLVPFGGGKDSLVALHQVKNRSVRHALFTLNPSPLHQQVAEGIDAPWWQVSRQIAPDLLQINQQGAYNGHVPITAIVSCVAVCVALMRDFREIAFANEASADEATLLDDTGDEVNHQWSKGSAFEHAFAELVANEIASELRYGSVVRNLSELEIARRFAGLTQYHQVFSSCNRNFCASAGEPVQRWCCDCPKCRFTFLALAPHLPPDSMIDIFGGNLLADATQTRDFAALAALDADKPFECVGEAREARSAMRHLASDVHWKDTPVIQALTQRFGDVLDQAAPLEAFFQ